MGGGPEIYPCVRQTGVLTCTITKVGEKNKSK